MISINEQDIAEIENIFLPDGEHFNEERIAIIKCLESKDIQACPGSGKTTTLLSKLLIIANQLPLPSNKGICVLTHTNVAINEVKERLGDKSQKLFKYPNYFGTIQSFVDKFLAVPAFIDKYNKRPYRIDDDVFGEVILKRYRFLNIGAKTWLEYNCGNSSPIDLLKIIRFSPSTFELHKGVYGPLVIQNKLGPAYQGLNIFKLRILKDGFLCFDDAFSLALNYISAYPDLKNLFSERFSFVFIDEMQDTRTVQSNVLNHIFDGHKVVIQKIGDINQSIFDSHNDGEGCAWTVGPEHMAITGSKRFSTTIANTIKTICVDPQDLQGNPNIRNITPKLIIFDDSKIDKVLSTFGDLIIQNGLHSYNKPIFKAIGRIGKEHPSKVTLHSYFDSFSTNIRNNKAEFSNLTSYLHAQSRDYISSHGAQHYRNSILKAVLKSMRLAGVRCENGRPFNEFDLLNHLDKNYHGVYQDLLTKLTTWSLSIHNRDDVFDEVASFISIILSNVFSSSLDEVQDFLTKVNVTPETSANQPKQEANIYNHTYGSVSIDIEISTVHSVKGETHTATLYLETFFYHYDVNSIIDYFKGNHISPTPRKTNTLKIAYVGLSRPRELLCVALHTPRDITDLDKLAAAGWEIIIL